MKLYQGIVTTKSKFHVTLGHQTAACSQAAWAFSQLMAYFRASRAANGSVFHAHGMVLGVSIVKVMATAHFFCPFPGARRVLS